MEKPLRYTAKVGRRRQTTRRDVHPFHSEGGGEDSTAPQGAGLQRHLAEHRERGEVGG